ncbi:MAG: tetratricopeptide repeat protein [Gammaproteobacteria bacterium]|nr:tetratricopeptide repeat protein [Gammaproteobacteria bacterium]
MRPALLVVVGLVYTTVLVQGTWGHGDRSEHLAGLDAKIEADPDSPHHLLERAEAHRRLGHYDESLADLDRVLVLSPGNLEVHYLRGLTHFDRGEFADAEASLRRYLESKPDSSSAHIALAKTLTQQGRHLEAGDEYTLAIAAQPTPIPNHFIARAKAYRAAGEQFLDPAVEGLDDGMSLMGPLVTLQGLAIEIELDRGNHAGAIARVDDVLANAPRKETWLLRKGRILASAGHQEQALDAFRLARASFESLPPRVRSTPAMIALRDTIAIHLDKDTSP